MKALDLFCCGGGAGMGLYQAGFEVVGVDINPQPKYPFKFIQSCVFDYLDSTDISEFSFLWASPPCQSHTSLKNCQWDREEYRRKHVCYIEEIRGRFEASGKPFCIENVVGSPLMDPVMLCGSNFDLKTACGAGLQRHRLFECNFFVQEMPCSHPKRTIGIFGDKARDTSAEKRHYKKDKKTRGRPPSDIRFSLEAARQAMGTDWLGFKEMSQAIPPCYSKHIADQWLKTQPPQEKGNIGGLYGPLLQTD